MSKTNMAEGTTRDTAHYRATAASAQGFGESPQEALAALMRDLPADSLPPIVIWPYNRGDAFWTDAQQARLEDLRSRLARLTDPERAELDSLVGAAFDAAVARTRSLPLTKS